VIQSQGYSYRAILWEIDMFIENSADDYRDKYYLNWDYEDL
jgi:hypothetical protein